MARSEESPRVGIAQSQENRAHPRRKLAPMAYVELGQDNGGILLNLSEGGFSVQSALPLTSRDFTPLRFQVPNTQGWLTASGTIAWISESKKEAGIQFTELPAPSRSEIRRWVSSGDSAQSSDSGTPPPSRDPQSDVFNTRTPRARPPLSPQIRSNGTNTPVAAATASVPTPVAAPARAPVLTRAEPQLPVAEANPAAFHFTDYSMFASEPETEQQRIWIKPEKKGMSWGALTLLGLLFSGLFFVLGATVGRGTIEQWIANITNSPARQASPAPQASGSAPTDQPSSASEQTPSEANQSAQDRPDAAGDTPSANSGDASAATNAKPPQPEASRAGEQAGAPSADGPLARNSGVAPRKEIARKNSASPKVEPTYPQAAPPRSYDDLNAGSTASSGDRTILVNAPAPGSPPFFVNLPGDPVSASSTVAISAQRSIAIAPRAGSYGRAQRVVIGKLLSHSDPFYPAEARSRRVQGSVVLHVIIGRTGHVIGVTPVRGPTELMNAAIAAVREWRYEPTYIDGDPAETQADITLVFRLP